jgi:GxxExxY protein
MTEIIHKDISFAVNGCIFDVHNNVGPGVREESYQKGMEISLAHRGLPFIAKPHTRRELLHEGEVADIFEPDFVIADRLILELKAQREGLSRINFMQTLNYVKFWGFSLGLLANFAEARAVIERVPYHPRQVAITEEYGFIKPFLTPSTREDLRVVRDSLLAVHREFGVGFWDTTYRNLADIEFRHRGLKCRRNLEVTPRLHGRELPSSPITPLLIGSDLLVEVESLHEEVTGRAIRTMQSHLELTQARIGIVVNFGKDRFEIRGVAPLKN